jgi:hypothetical protein
MIMLKREVISTIGDEVWDRVIKLLESGHESFKFDGDESLLYKSEDQEKIENYLGIKLNGESLSEHIECFYGGEYLEVYRNIQIGKDDCIKIVQENFSRYEDRIWNTDSYDDCYNEIEKIIKEQMYKVFLDVIKEGFETINNGDFKWD